MQAFGAMCAIIRSSGISRSKVGLLMGKSDGYIHQTISRGSIPRADTLAEIADVCGYNLVLVKRDGSETIQIDPPQR